MRITTLATLVGIAILFVLASTLYESIIQHTAIAAGNNSTNSLTDTPSINSTATSSSNTTAANLTSPNTFSAAGSISSLIYPNVTMPTSSQTTPNTNVTTNGNASFNTANVSGASVLTPKTFILSGFWHLKVDNGNITFFDVRFTKVHLDATNRHTHEITNFTMAGNSSNSSVKLNANGTTTITGTTGVALNNVVVWRNVKTTIAINNLSTIVISLDPKDTSNHFLGQSIYGVVTMIKDKNGKVMESFPSIIHR